MDSILRDEPQRRGVRAIIVYPMNALINSQLEALEAYKERNWPDSRALRTLHRPAGREDRDAHSGAPHILLTNYVCSNTCLFRQFNARCSRPPPVTCSSSSWTSGTSTRPAGADVACCFAAFEEKEAGRFRSSDKRDAATGENRDERSALRSRRASRLFGTKVVRIRVVEETLRPIATIRKRPRTGALRAAGEQTPPPAGADATEVAAHPLAAWAERAFGIAEEDGLLIRRLPATFVAAVDQLVEATGLDQHRCQKRLRAVLEAGNSAKAVTDDPLFAFRLHQFLSSGSSVYATLEPGAERQLSMEGRYDAGDGKPFYPLAFCRECGQEYYLVGRIEEGAGNQLVPRSPMVGAPDEDIRGTAGYFSFPNGEDGLWSGDSEELPDHWLRLTRSGATVKPEYRDYVPIALSVDATGEPGELVEGWYQPRPLMICLRCRTAWDRTNRSDFTKLSSLSQTGRSTSATVAVNALVADMTAQNADPGQRKVLSFTDNRQDAALQAGHLNDFVQVAQGARRGRGRHRATRWPRLPRARSGAIRGSGSAA